MSVVSPGRMICFDLSVTSGSVVCDIAGVVGAGESGVGEIGIRDSGLVARTVHFPSRRVIWLRLKSCITSLSSKNKVPPIQSVCRFGQISALNLSLCPFL